MNKTSKTREVIDHFFTSLEVPIKPLTLWEKNFLESIYNQYNEKGTLTDKQFDILEKIYAEKTA